MPGKTFYVNNGSISMDEWNTSECSFWMLQIYKEIVTSKKKSIKNKDKIHFNSQRTLQNRSS